MRLLSMVSVALASTLFSACGSSSSGGTPAAPSAGGSTGSGGTSSSSGGSAAGGAGSAGGTSTGGATAGGAGKAGATSIGGSSGASGNGGAAAGGTGGKAGGGAGAAAGNGGSAAGGSAGTGGNGLGCDSPAAVGSCLVADGGGMPQGCVESPVIKPPCMSPGVASDTGCPSAGAVARCVVHFMANPSQVSSVVYYYGGVTASNMTDCAAKGLAATYCAP